MKRPYLLQFDSDDVKAWRHSAWQSKMKLSSWISQQCNEAAPMQPILAVPVSQPPTESPTIPPPTESSTAPPSKKKI